MGLDNVFYIIFADRYLPETTDESWDRSTVGAIQDRHLSNSSGEFYIPRSRKLYRAEVLATNRKFHTINRSFMANKVNG